MVKKLIFSAAAVFALASNVSANQNMVFEYLSQNQKSIDLYKTIYGDTGIRKLKSSFDINKDANIRPEYRKR